MNNGHPYTMGMQYSLNPSFPYWVVRTDLVTKEVTRKILPGTLSQFQRAYFVSIFDSLGHLWLPIATTNFHIFDCNFKGDSIEVIDRGLPFKDAKGDSIIAITYSMRLGTDGNIHVGIKGGTETAYWNRNEGRWHSYNETNNADWVLGVAGDKDYLYSVTGQQDTCNVWVIRKSDGFSRELSVVPSYTRQSVGCYSNPAPVFSRTFFSDPTRGYAIYEIINMDTVHVPYSVGTNPEYKEMVDQYGTNLITSFWDAPTAKLQYAYYNINDQVTIPANFSQTGLQVCIVDKYNAKRLWVVGTLYGDYYQYDLDKDSSWGVGHTGYNLYSYRRLDDSIFFLGSYPGGALMEWNVNKTWTAETFSNGTVIHATDTSANPHIIYQYKDSAGFQHPANMILDTVRHLVICAGDVIRVDSSCSIGVFNYKTKKGYGYNYHKIGRLSLSGITQYGDLIIFSTAIRFPNNDTAKLYFYDPVKNTMVDSIGFGLSDYGGTWVQGDQLLGHAGTIFYKINLSTKKVIYNQQGVGNSNVSRLQDGKFVISGGTPPAGWGQFKTSAYSNFSGIGNGDYYSISGDYLIQSKNLATETIDLNTAAGKMKYIKNMLYNQ